MILRNPPSNEQHVSLPKITIVTPSYNQGHYLDVTVREMSRIVRYVTGAA